MPTTITCEASDKSRIASITCVNKVTNHVLSRIENNIDTIYVVSDGCASQFRSKYIFKLSTRMYAEKSLMWHYNEAHHGPMDGIGGTLKNTVFRRVLAGDAVINTPEQFASYANKVCQIDSLYLSQDEIPVEPDDVQNAIAT